MTPSVNFSTLDFQNRVCVQACPSASGINYFDPSTNTTGSWGTSASANDVLLDFTSTSNWATVKTKIAASIAASGTPNFVVQNTGILNGKLILGSTVLLSGFN